MFVIAASRQEVWLCLEPQADSPAKRPPSQKNADACGRPSVKHVDAPARSPRA